MQFDLVEILRVYIVCEFAVKRNLTPVTGVSLPRQQPSLLLHYRVLGSLASNASSVYRSRNSGRKTVYQNSAKHYFRQAKIKFCGISVTYFSPAISSPAEFSKNMTHLQKFKF